MIKEPKQRSSRWVSTSIPQAEWDSPLAFYSSAEYHVNNLVSPVLFHDGLNLVPDNAVVVEIAPHALLQVCAHYLNCYIYIYKKLNVVFIYFVLFYVGGALSVVLLVYIACKT